MKHKCFVSLVGFITFIVFIIFPFLNPILLKAYEVLPITVDFNGVIEKNGPPKPWFLRVNNGKAHISVLHQKDENILYLKSESSSFSLGRDISISPEDYPYVTWRWKAMKLPLSGDVRNKNRNDQGLQVLFAFENRKIISYVWDANAPEGTVMNESIGWPFNLSIKVIVVNSGSAGMNEWVSNTRNIYKDYRDLFNEKPPRLKGLRIQTNTQYTQDLSEGMVRGIFFSR